MTEQSSNKRRKKRDVNRSNTSNLYYYSVEHCYLNLPEDMVEDNPFDLENIKEKQDADDKLTQSTVTHPTWYSHMTINDVEDILYYTKPGDNASSSPNPWLLSVANRVSSDEIEYVGPPSTKGDCNKLLGQRGSLQVEGAPRIPAIDFSSATSTHLMMCQL